MEFLERIKARVASAAAVFDSIGFVWLWIAISLLLLALVLLLNPAKLGAYLWFMSKLAGAASLGYGFDLAFFRGSDPRLMQDGIEKNLAHFHAADPEYGKRVEEAVRALRED